MMLLENKTAVIYGAGGSIGSAVARAFAREGAHVFLAGQTLAKLETVAQEIVGAGGMADAAQVDALNQESIESHLRDVMDKIGRLDISFNAIGLGDAQGAPLVSMTPAHFMLPIATAMNSQFLTATAGARSMAQRGSGVILALTANVARVPRPAMGGFGIACAAIEAFCRQLATEVGLQGIRVVCMRSSGSPDTPGVVEAMKVHARNAGITLEAFAAKDAEKTLLKRLPLLAEVANIAVLMASDYANTVTGAVINVTCGELVD